jgi:hypothetical protein
MYENWLVNLAVVAATVTAVALWVKVLYGMSSMLALHIAEIWIFGLLIWALLQWPACGHVVSGSGAAPGVFGLLDSVYLSAVTYTTVGFGDVVPVGPIRFASGMEALTGFLMIGWSASFTYLEMERFWHGR